MTTTMLSVTLYLRCLACRYRFSSQYRSAKCPRCHAATRIYGVCDDPEMQQPSGHEEGRC